MRFLFISVFITDIFVSSISNYKPYSFYIKTFCSLLLFSFIYFDIKLQNLSPRSIFNKDRKKFFITPIAFILFPLLTISYSANPQFGFLKWLYLLLSIVPLIISFRYLLFFKDKYTIKTASYLIAAAGTVFAVLVILLRPFDYTTVYSFNISRWSHIISGKFLAFSLLITLFFLMNEKIKSNRFFIFTFIYFIQIFAVYLTGSRAAIIGAGIFTIITPLIFLLKNKIELKKFVIVLAGFMFAALIAVYLLNLATVEQRLTDFFVHLKSGNFIGDSLRARKLGLEKGVEIFKENFLFGTGFGGYNQPGNPMLNQLKYPHNIFLETAVEFGITGLTFLAFLLYKILRDSYNFSLYLFLIILMGFWFSLTSKDLATQSLLWMGIAALESGGKQ